MFFKFFFPGKVFTLFLKCRGFFIQYKFTLLISFILEVLNFTLMKSLLYSYRRRAFLNVIVSWQKKFWMSYWMGTKINVYFDFTSDYPINLKNFQINVLATYFNAVLLHRKVLYILILEVIYKTPVNCLIWFRWSCILKFPVVVYLKSMVAIIVTNFYSF